MPKQSVKPKKSVKPKGPVRPGDTPFNKLTFTNNRANAVKVTITGRSTLATNPPPATMDCPVTPPLTTWVPPAGSWKNIFQIMLTIQKSASPNEIVGAVLCKTPMPAAGDPREVASSASCQLTPDMGSGGNNCTLKLLDAEDREEALTNMYVEASN